VHWLGKEFQATVVTQKFAKITILLLQCGYKNIGRGKKWLLYNLVTVWDKVSLLTVQAVENWSISLYTVHVVILATHPECKLLDSLEQSDILLEVWVPILGKHTPDVYSWTMLSYRCNRVSGFEHSEKQWCIIPKNFSAFAQVCLDHVRSEVSRTPKYLKHSTCSSTWPQCDNTGRWRGFLFLDNYKHGFAFANIRVEVVYRYPFHSGVYVILELLIVLRCFNVSVQ